MLAQGQGQQYQPYGRSSQQPNPGYYQIPHQASPEFPRPNQQVPPSRYQGSMSSQSNGSHQGGNTPAQMAAGHGGLGALGQASTYYPSPFQNHIDKLGKFLPFLYG
ncbi:hypothetical protein KC321_g18756 [Hortaea werneckii]|nr:hypothetical protein KC321_g18756 [Hortaea werneckii]